MKPPFDEPIVAELERDRMHAADLGRALDDLARRLVAEGIPFALLGALAMRHYGYVRHTEDVDILTTPDGLRAIHERLVGRGLVPRARGLRKGLRHSEFHVNVDIIQAGEKAGSNESPVAFPDPSSDAFVDAGGIRIPSLALLIQLKLASGIWGHRLRDLADVASLIRANGLDETMADRLAPEVRPKYHEVLAEARREVDREE